MATKKKHRPYELKEYDKVWPKKFEEIVSIVRKILGEEVIEVYHVGSTSVPGMVAKPQIDVLVVVKDIAKIKDYRNEMGSKGFIYLGNYIGEGQDCFAVDERGGRRVATIHCVQIGGQEITNLLNFRDYLRANDEARKEYSDIKKKLYEEYSNDYTSYGPGKKDFIVRTIKKANNWAKKQKIRF